MAWTGPNLSVRYWPKHPIPSDLVRFGPIFFFFFSFVLLGGMLFWFFISDTVWYRTGWQLAWVSVSSLWILSSSIWLNSFKWKTYSDYLVVATHDCVGSRLIYNKTIQGLRKQIWTIYSRIFAGVLRLCCNYNLLLTYPRLSVLRGR